MKIIDKDAYGKGLLAYQKGMKNAKFTVHSDLAETEKWDVSTFFRSFEKMPEIEQIALNRCEGRVLDAGAGAGSHALWLQSQGKDVTAIDISQGAVEVMTTRGVKDSRLQDFFSMKEEKYDSLLLLMNGIGIVGTLDNLTQFFVQAKKMLNPGGKIVMDSSNIIYMYEDEDGSALINLNAAYYGEMTYRMDFGNYKGVDFEWVYIDFDTLDALAQQHGFKCEKIYEDEHYHYLAELTF
jgi:2-polyprenyl-3-methyl-5-hydroxy-6-metoxy-1,4-benzoquinol methylase